MHAIEKILAKNSGREQVSVVKWYVPPTPGLPGRNLSRAEQYTGKEISEKAQDVLHEREEQLRDKKEK